MDLDFFGIVLEGKIQIKGKLQKTDLDIMGHSRAGKFCLRNAFNWKTGAFWKLFLYLNFLATLNGCS